MLLSSSSSPSFSPSARVPLPAPGPGPRGLAGWLLLPALALLAAPLYLLADAARTVHLLSQPGAWEQLASPAAPGYHPLLPSLLHFEILAGLVGFVVGVWAALAFFRRRASAPGRVIAFFGLALGLQGIGALWAGQLPVAWAAAATNPWRAAVPLALLCAVGVPYFLASRRVANTFIR